MELLYIWIEDYLNIKNCGFSFKSRLLIEQETDIQKKSLKVTLKTNDNYIENFFGENIVNITAIIGENGAGKSNVLDCIKELVDSKSFDKSGWLIILYNEDKGIIEIIHSLFDYGNFTNGKQQYKDEWMIEVENCCQHQHILSKASGGAPQSKEVNSFTGKFIYYSPHLDFRNLIDYYHPPENSGDVSANTMLYNDSRNQHRSRSVVEIHKHKNIERQLNLVSSGIIDTGIISIPKTIEVITHKNNYEDELNEKKFDEDFNQKAKLFYKEFKKSATRTRIRVKDEKPINEDKINCNTWFLVNLVENFLYLLERNTNFKNKHFNVSADLTEFDFENEDVSTLAKKFFKYQTLNKSGFDTDAFIDEVSAIIMSHESSADRENHGRFSTTPEQAIKILRLNREYVNSFDEDTTVRTFIEFNWRSISSGEKAILDLFSRLHTALEYLKSKPTGGNETVYMLLDEGESGFHPEWQRIYISMLIDYLSRYPEFRFHLILTTHSPLIASDLQVDNLVLLEKDTMRNCLVQKKLNSTTETFGASVQKLLAENFFMKNGLMGEFARKKITKLFEYKKNDFIEHKDYFMRLLNQVAEPLIRKKLQESFIKEMGNTHELEIIENEIKRLQNLKKEIINKK
jgi:predicted ATP-dependent endonuclease of OLD family